MQNWRVKDNYIQISDKEAVGRIDDLVGEYVKLIPKLGHHTPETLLDVLQFRYDDWFKAIDPKVNLKFIEALDKTLVKMDVDPYWEVSFDYQKKAGDVFNEFLTAMKKLNPSSKKDKLVVSNTLNAAFGKAYGVAPTTEAIMRALNNKELARIAKRLVKTLGKMGYAF